MPLAVGCAIYSCAGWRPCYISERRWRCGRPCYPSICYPVTPMPSCGSSASPALQSQEPAAPPAGGVLQGRDGSQAAYGRKPQQRHLRWGSARHRRRAWLWLWLWRVAVVRGRGLAVSLGRCSRPSRSGATERSPWRSHADGARLDGTARQAPRAAGAAAATRPSARRSLRRRLARDGATAAPRASQATRAMARRAVSSAAAAPGPRSIAPRPSRWRRGRRGRSEAARGRRRSRGRPQERSPALPTHSDGSAATARGSSHTRRAALPAGRKPRIAGAGARYGSWRRGNGGSEGRAGGGERCAGGALR